ncbi:unnamed protein product [Rotaria sp. Silwood1]|nr:unnamed protein product [Rotaria sp. Silwood1]
MENLFFLTFTHTFVERGMFIVELRMHIHILLCATAIWTVTQSTPIAVSLNDVKDESTTSQKIASHVQNPADFVAAKAPRSKRNSRPSLPVAGGDLSARITGDGVYATWTRTFDSGGCLYGDDLVLLQDGSRKQLKNLRSGDKVYSIDQQGKLVKDEIIMMLHGGPKTEGES